MSKLFRSVVNPKIVVELKGPCEVRVSAKVKFCGVAYEDVKTHKLCARMTRDFHEHFKPLAEPALKD